MPTAKNAITITERQIQDTLHRELFSSHALICPNYAPAGWWECDLFSVTNSGYVVEHEIKISVADFKKDAEKRRSEFAYTTGLFYPQRRGTNKHECLAASDCQGPSRFYYVAPKGVLLLADIPAWAGFKEVVPFYDNDRNPNFFRTIETKKAPVLHRVKPDVKVLAHVAGVFYSRFWNERRRNKGAAGSAGDK